MTHRATFSSLQLVKSLKNLEMNYRFPLPFLPCVSRFRSLNNFFPCLILSELPLPHLLSFILKQTLIDTFQGYNFQSKCFRSKFADGTKTNRKCETKDEK